MIESITIKLSEKEYLVKRNWKSLIMFEEMTKKSIDDIKGSVKDLIMLFYSILKANNKDFTLSIDEFIDILDENEDAVESFTSYIQRLAGTSENTDDKKKV
jgi:hypothetical protein